MTADAKATGTDRWSRCQWGLYGITHATPSGHTHEQVAGALLAAGVRVIQFRDKSLPFEDLLAIGRRLRAMTSEARTDLIVNDNPYLAVEINADGCHIGQDDMPPAIARSILGPERILGLSTHSAEQALAAQLEPIDYIGVGPVYATTTKQSGNMPVGPALVQWARQTISYPLVAIGGISGETIAEVVNAGAHNVAIIGDIIRGPDMAGRAAQFRAMIDDALASRRARLEANIGRGL